MLGLTGGIGAGKSTVAELLAQRGAFVLDTDEIARDVVGAGGLVHEAVLDRFGTVDRPELARLVFGDAGARADLNAIVHPAVEAVVRERLAEVVGTGTDRVVVLVVPLLVEAGWERMVSCVVVVDTPPDVAVGRVVESRAMAEEDVRQRMAAQATREERLAMADVVLHNDGSLDDLERQVDELWSSLLK